MLHARAACLTLAASLALSASSAAPSQTPAWSRMAEEDLAAAKALIDGNHPGAVPERGDRLFQSQLGRGYEEALAIARAARTFGAYRAALERFAAGFQDPHIFTSASVEPDRFWPGYAVAWRDGRWQVVASVDEKGPAVGSTLLSCDGRTPDALAESRLAPFSPNWTVSAERVRISRMLLQDSGNPLQPRLGECTLAGPDGSTEVRRLNWRRIGAAELHRHAAAGARLAGEDVFLRPFGNGWWIRLGTSGSSAAALLEEARSRRDALRAAPYLVLDLRGNAGGATYFTDELAGLIYGAQRAARARHPAGTREPETIVWRASPDTLTTIEAYVERGRRLVPEGHPLLLGLIAQREAIKRSIAAGAPLARAPAEVGADPSSARDVVRRPPPVVLVTDRSCFSSCLGGVLLFRTLGRRMSGRKRGRTPIIRT